ncbi:MAG: hypothetical protein JWL83_4363 [Actinomycetia bacterium]|nr:hypothetical protein [Actinomycetes bacterium]
MGAVWLRFQADVRRHIAVFVALALLVGIASGVVMTAAAGARRTNTTLPRYFKSALEPDVLVNPDNLEFDKPAAMAKWAQLDHLPNVVASGEIRGVNAIPVRRDGRPDVRYFGDIIAANPDGLLFQKVYRSNLVAGRAPDQRNPHEIVINRELARKRHLRVGSELRIWRFTDQDTQVTDVGQLKPRPAYPVTVTGIDLPLDDASRATDDPRFGGVMLFTRAFAELPGVRPIYAGKMVRLRHGAADLPTFERAATTLLAQNLNFQETRLTEARVIRAVRPFVVALSLFAVLAALVGGLVVAQTVTRQHRADARDHDVLTALGFTQRDRVALGAARGAVIGMLGAVVAVVGAWAASSIMPIGPVRALDPVSGRSVDTVVFVISVVVIVAFTTVHGALVAVLAPSMRRRRAHAEVPPLLPAPIATGVRFALDRGQGSSSLPLRSTLLGVVVAISALVASMVYGAGLAHFTSTPRLYGWVWDFQVEPGDPAQVPAVAHALARDPSVKAYAEGQYTQLDFGTSSVAAIALARARGVPVVETLAGRAPASDNEVALGTSSMRTLGAHIGDTVYARGPAGRYPLRVVGRAVFARFAPYPGSEPTGLGTGAAITMGALKHVTPDGRGNGNHFFLVMNRPGTSVNLAASKTRLFPSNVRAGDVWGPQRPNDVLSYQRLERTPLLLAALLLLLGAATTVHLLVTGVRRRRRDLGLLKAIGCTVRQIVSIVLAQATTLVALSLFVAVPAGVIAGRFAWLLTAHWLGIPAQPMVPLTVVAIVVIVALAAANVVALLPGLRAARVRAAVALRTE